MVSSIPVPYLTHKFTFFTAHPIDIYTLAVTRDQIISASGVSTLKIHSTTTPDFAIAQVLKDAHPLGCHHLATSHDGMKLVSVGFGGEAKVWKFVDGMWVGEGELEGLAEGGGAGKKSRKKLNVGEMWAVALSEEGRYLAGTSYDGRIGVWDLLTEGRRKIREYETKGSFGLCVDMVRRAVTHVPFRAFRLLTDDHLPVSGWAIYSLWARKWKYLRLQQRLGTAVALATRACQASSHGCVLSWRETPSCSWGLENHWALRRQLRRAGGYSDRACIVDHVG